MATLSCRLIVPPVSGSISRAVDAALVDGLILLGLAPGHPDLEHLRRSGIPLVGLDVEQLEDHDVIGIDDVGGSRRAAEHLVGLGHRDVAVVLIAEHPDSPIDERSGISARRLRGTRGGFGIGANGDGSGEGAVRLRILSTPVSEDGGRAAFAALVADDDPPTAVMTMSDVTAIGIMAAALDARLSIPGDLSIIGFDDIPAASWTTPRLTTVHQPIREKGRRAAQRLISAIRSGSEHRPLVELLPTRLVVRGSTGPPRGDRTLSGPGGGGDPAA